MEAVQKEYIELNVKNIFCTPISKTLFGQPLLSIF